jgi:PAS domain S-box-containing protein
LKEIPTISFHPKERKRLFMGIPEQEQDHLLLLRRRAEEALQGKRIEVTGLSEYDIQFLMHELQVHQAELALQNDELRQTQETLEVSRDRYATLYDFAPAGYCTISQKDVIVEANQSLANLLDVGKQGLLHKTFSTFVSRIDQDKYYLFRRRAFEKHGHESGEIRMVKHSGDLVYVRLESRLAEGKDQLMIMVIDITNQRDLQRRIIEQREKERQKIARDLHDGPIQMLAAINFNLQRILMGNLDEEVVKSLEAIQADLRDQIQVLRGFSVELRSPLLAHIGLETALRSTIDNFA